MKVIGIHGKKRSGKDYLANLLKIEFERLGKSVKIYHYADPLKDMVCSLLNIDLETLNALKNSNEKIGICSLSRDLMTMREFLQRFGTEMMQTFFTKNVWVNMVDERLKSATEDIFIVPDIRFEHEYNHVLNNKGYLVHVINPEHDYDDMHSSEIALDCHFHYEFINTNSDISNNVNDIIKGVLNFNV